MVELELAESNIAEIVLEHPGLELCRHHVEIVDSPGLNDHPDRTAVTERLLQNADAAIFLANASRPMTKGERSLLENLKMRLQKGSSEAPADNLFVLVNFMDLLQSQDKARTQKNKEQVTKRVENVVLKPAAPLLKDENRVHFISAQFALEAILTQTPNEYSKPFAAFTNALETFLVEERGELSLRKEIADVRQFMSVIQDNFEQKTHTLEGDLRLTIKEKKKILEQIGEISGFDVAYSHDFGSSDVCFGTPLEMKR